MTEGSDDNGDVKQRFILDDGPPSLVAKEPHPDTRSISAEEESAMIIQKSLSLVSYGMVIQLVWRAMSFLLNAVLLRYVSAAMLGVANVRLALLYSTLMFLSREAFRRACLGHTKPKQWKTFVNLLWLIVPIGSLWACILVPIWLFVLSRPREDEVPYYDQTTVLFILGVFAELLCEPLWIISQLRLCVRVRMFVEGACVFVRSGILIFLVVLYPSLGLLAFGWAQFIMALFISLTFWVHCFYCVATQRPGEPLSKISDYLPSLTEYRIDMQMASLVFSFFTQSILKQLLTEGERYIMSFFSLLNFAEQGVYDAVNNLGSLVARFIFQPLEDSAYLLFSQTLSRGKNAADQDQTKLETAYQYLSQTLRFSSVIAAVIWCFGQTYSVVALHIYGGELLAGEHSSGPILMRTFSFYVMFIAWNGLTESFSFALMSEKELNRHNYRFLWFSAIYVLIAVLLGYYLGAVGFILANCVNMLLRIRFNCTFIYFFFRTSKTKENPLWSMMPHPPVLMSLVAALGVTLLSQSLLLDVHNWTSVVWHISIGAAALSVVVGVIFTMETECVEFFVSNVFRKRRQQKE